MKSFFEKLGKQIEKSLETHVKEESQSQVAQVKAHAPEYVGLPLSKAQDLAEARGHVIREVKKDDEELSVTMDFMYNRINVATEKGVIQKIVDVG